MGRGRVKSSREAPAELKSPFHPRNKNAHFPCKGLSKHLGIELPKEPAWPLGPREKRGTMALRKVVTTETSLEGVQCQGTQRLTTEGYLSSKGSASTLG